MGDMGPCDETWDKVQKHLDGEDPVLTAIEEITDCNDLTDLKHSVKDILLTIRKRQNELSDRIFRLYDMQTKTKNRV